MAIHSLFPRAESDLQVVALTITSWVVRDRRTPVGDPQPILGHIDLCRGRYEVLQLGDPLVFATAGTLAEATAQFTIPAVLTDDHNGIPAPLRQRLHRASA
ncbi:MAG: hypothetical protein JWQ43_3206 [Glaciihabitans sp.]|nr:hypothetical protein [Glaciihabitans sp.]